MAQRVFVTGLGVVSPLGSDVASYWEGLLYKESRPGIYQHTRPAYIPNRLFYNVPDWSPEDARQQKVLAGRASTFAIRAAEMALRDAGLLDAVQGSTIGVSLGTGMGDSDLLDDERTGGPAVPPDAACFFRVSALVAERFGLTGPNLSVSNACSASGYSVGLAYDAISEGWADVMVAGGVEGFSRVAQACFHRMGALDPYACRPFDQDRAGTVFGEGAAVLVLESEEHARRRGCQRYFAEIKGSGWSCDGHHPTAPDPNGLQPEHAANRALASAGVQPDEIDCVVPHGTGTALNDVMESALLERLFGPRLEQVHLCAVKSKLGHSGGASGAFSILTAALILNHGLVPPTGNVQAVDPQCRIKVHTDQPIRAPIRHVLINAYAFGGNNISVVMGRVGA